MSTYLLHAMGTTTQPVSAFTPVPVAARQTTVYNHYDRLSSALTYASSLSHLKQIHAQIIRSGLDRSNSLLLKLVLSSASVSSSLDYTLSVFDSMYKPETHLCNKFLRELTRSVDPKQTLLVYEKMRRRGLVIDRFSFPLLLKASSRVSAISEGMEIHGLASKLGFDSDPFVQTALVGMYSACGKIEDARLMFDKMSHRDVVTWNIMISGYCQSGHLHGVLSLFEEMKSSDVEPDGRIVSTILSACGRAGNLEHGKAIHEFIVESDIVLDSHLHSALVTMYSGCGAMDVAQSLYDNLSPKTVVASTGMLSGYAKLGQLEAARSIFNQMAEKDLVCWSAMISGYAESSHPQEALRLFNEMQFLGVKPDQVAMLSVISACAHLGALDHAKWIHMFVDRNGFGEALPINNALIDMYAKCGSLEGAQGVFGRMLRKNVISWTSIISAFAMHGAASDALNHFYQMKTENIEPNWITFVGVLYACSHAGLVKEGQRFFASMVNEYSITAKHEHYGCLVDLYGRANHLREALEVVETMPLPPNVVIWGSLMAACWNHGEFELGAFAAKQLLEMDPNHDGALVLLSNIYAKERRWENVVEVRKLMKHRGISKEHGCSRIELDGEIHEFLMADKNHKQSDKIYAKLAEVADVISQAGYASNTCNVLIDLDEEEKKEMVLRHSEKLALSYGLIRAERGCSIRIIKNLRMCEDCHTFMKTVSKVYEREIIIRDRTRFHHFRDGMCSCEDYW